MCLITLKGEGMNESELRDVGHYKCARKSQSVPAPPCPNLSAGYRQIQIYVDPLKLRGASTEPHGRRPLGERLQRHPSRGRYPHRPVRLQHYANSEVETVNEIAAIPLKTIGQSSVLIGDVAEAKDASQTQYNIVRVDGQRSAYQPVLKQGGDANTIAIVNGVHQVLAKLVDVPKQLVTQVVFDQSRFVKCRGEPAPRRRQIGLLLTGLMILLFLGNMVRPWRVPFHSALGAGGVHRPGHERRYDQYHDPRWTRARLFATSSTTLWSCWKISSGTWNWVSRRRSPREEGGREVALPVLAATLTTAVVFFPVMLLSGASRYLFQRAGAGGDAFAVRLLFRRADGGAASSAPKLIESRARLGENRIRVRTMQGDEAFTPMVQSASSTRCSIATRSRSLKRSLLRPKRRRGCLGLMGTFRSVSDCIPFLADRLYFPRTDPGSLQSISRLAERAPPWRRRN